MEFGLGDHWSHRSKPEVQFLLPDGKKAVIPVNSSIEQAEGRNGLKHCCRTEYTAVYVWGIEGLKLHPNSSPLPFTPPLLIVCSHENVMMSHRTPLPCQMIV